VGGLSAERRGGSSGSTLTRTPEGRCSPPAVVGPSLRSSRCCGCGVQSRAKNRCAPPIGAVGPGKTIGVEIDEGDL